MNVGRAMKETFEFGISVKGEQKRRQEVKGLAMNSFYMLTHVRIWSAAVSTSSADCPHLSLYWQPVTSHQHNKTVPLDAVQHTKTQVGVEF